MSEPSMSENWRPINLNHNVRFKLTPLGEKLWLDHYRPYARFGVEPTLPRRDGEWFVDQLWQVMQILGTHIGNGLPIPLETEIQLRVPHAGRAPEEEKHG